MTRLITLHILTVFIIFVLATVAWAQTSRMTAVGLPSGYGISHQGAPVSAGGRLFYPSNTSANGTELVSTDASLNSVHEFDLLPGNLSGDPQNITSVGNRVVFTADDGLTGRELCASDGTPAGTIGLTDFAAGSSNSFFSNEYTISFGSWALISRSAERLVATDGTVAGTKQLSRPNALHYGFAAGGKAVVLIDNSGTIPDSLFLYDYASNSLSFLTTIASRFYSVYPGERPVNTVVSGNRFAIGFGTKIAFSDGTRQGSFVVAASDGEAIGNVRELAFFDGKVYFAGYTESKGDELHVLDPQTRTATLAADVNRRPLTAGSNMTQSSLPECLVVFDDTLFFIADDGFFGYELHKLKGTSLRRVSDMGQGTFGIEGASLDTAFGGLAIGRDQSFGRSHIYRLGRIVESPHILYRFSGSTNRCRATSIVQVPERNLRLAFFVDQRSGRDSLVALSGGARFSYYEPSNRLFFVTGPAVQTYAFAGSSLYLGSGNSQHIWRLEDAPSAIPVQASGESSFYPNPCRGGTLRYSGEKALTGISVYDGQGRCRQRLERLAGRESLALQGLAPGFYIIQAQNGSEQVRHQIIIE